MITVIDKDTNTVQNRNIRDIEPGLHGVMIVESPTRQDLAQLSAKLNLDYGNLCDALDINEAPRLEYKSNYDYLYLRTPVAKAKRNSELITKPMLAVYSNRLLIIISAEKLIPVLAGDTPLEQLIWIGDTAGALIAVLSKIIESYDYHIKEQTDAIHDVANKLQKHRLDGEDFTNFILIEDHINSFISALTPLTPLFNRLSTSHSLTLTSEQIDLLQDVILATQQSASVCDANCKRLTSIRDAYITISNNSLNNTMKLLTAATLLIAAPNLVFSMYGMNIHLPWQWNDFSFTMVVVLALSAIVLVLIWAKKKRLF